MAMRSAEGLIALLITVLLVGAGYLVAGVIRGRREWLIGGSLSVLLGTPLLLFFWKLERERITGERLWPYLATSGVLLALGAAVHFLRRRGMR